MLICSTPPGGTETDGTITEHTASSPRLAVRSCTPSLELRMTPVPNSMDGTTRSVTLTRTRPGSGLSFMTQRLAVRDPPGMSRPRPSKTPVERLGREVGSVGTHEHFRRRRLRRRRRKNCECDSADRGEHEAHRGSGQALSSHQGTAVSRNRWFVAVAEQV